jgi:hypothetical protein
METNIAQSHAQACLPLRRSPTESRRSFYVALVVGTILNLIIKVMRCSAQRPSIGPKILLTYVVPYALPHGAVSYQLSRPL